LKKSDHFKINQRIALFKFTNKGTRKWEKAFAFIFLFSSSPMDPN